MEHGYPASDWLTWVFPYLFLATRANRAQSPPRKIAQPAQTYKEKLWLYSPYQKPHGIVGMECLEDMKKFERIIWEHPNSMMITNYDHTPEEMAILCGEGTGGWLLSSHIDWILNKVNCQQNNSINLCLNTSSVKDVERLSERMGESIERLNFVINVGKNGDGSVYISDSKKSGNHWVFVTMELSCHPTVLYCDSLGWTSPKNLLECLVEYTKVFGICKLERLVLMHTPSASSHSHQCTADCKNYPVQSCTNVCGLVAVIGAVVTALDKKLFGELCGPKSNLKLFLHDPTRYEKYLRRVLIHWFMSEHITISFLKHSSPKTCTRFSHDHSYCSVISNFSQKRKATDTSPIPLKVHFKNSRPTILSSRAQDCSNLQQEPKIPLKNAEANIHVTSSKSQDCSNVQHPPSCPDLGESFEKKITLTNSKDLKIKTNEKKCSKSKPKIPLKNTEANIQHVTSSKSQDCSNVQHPPSCPDLEESFEKKITLTNPKDLKLRTDEEKCNKSKKENILKKWVCKICNANFAHKQGLYKHRKKTHSFSTLSKIKASEDNLCNCHCTLCSFKTNNILSLIDHYKKNHDKDIEVMQKSFQNEEEFQKWKKGMEKKTSSQYFLPRGSKKNVGNIVKHYYCHRSGQCRTKDKKLRSERSQGSKKMGNYCTSFITYHKNVKDDTVSVQYCLDHHNHSPSLGYLNLSDETRSQIAGKLAQGVEPGKILDNFRDDISSIDRDSLLTKKDIHNIKQQYNISNVQKHKEDGFSVDLWVKEFSAEKDNPIIFYKPQHSQHNILQDLDFLLCIQTKFQREMMLKYGSQIICADSTHSTTQYDFLLITLFVVDDFQEAIPIAWAISNREDVNVLQIFMEQLRISCEEDIKTNIFMSDMAENFYNAWCTSFSQPYKRLYCSWHVDRSWRKKINTIVKDDKIRFNIYTLLKVLQNETDHKKFSKLLQQTLTFLDKNNTEFYTYFKDNYVKGNKTLLWAACFRIGTLANTNMYAESFHNVLKSVYFSRKQNRRVDHLLIILLKIARDKNMDQIIKYEKGKITHRIKEIRARHKSSESIVDIKETSNTTWTVPSSNSQDHIIRMHTVEQIMTLACNCKLICNNCNVCVHKYNCNCIDYVLKGLSCKHIHAVHSSRYTHQKSENELVPDDTDEIETLKSFIQSSQAEKYDDINKLRQIALRKANDIIELLQNTDDKSAIKAVIDGLHNTYTIGCGIQKTKTDEPALDKKQCYASNKLFEPQRRFISTKKKAPVGSKLKLKKMNIIEKDKLLNVISETTSTVCARCCSDVDRNGNRELAKCISCTCLVHASCDLPIGSSTSAQSLDAFTNCSACRD